MNTEKCLTCKNWLQQYGREVPRCNIVAGTNCTYAIETGKCRYEPMEKTA